MTQPHCKAFLTVCGALVVLVSAPPVRAGNPAAESLFQEAIALMDAGKFQEACPKLDASHELEPRSGTLIVLASCHELQGRTATAWSEYKDAAELARTEGRQAKVDKALELAGAIEPKLSRVRIDVADRAAGLVVRIDGAPIADGALGVPVAIDPGDHVIDASAPGRSTWTQTVRVAPEEKLRIVGILSLPLAAPVSPGASSLAAVLPPPRAPRDGVADLASRAPTWAWIAGGAGLAALATSVVFRIDQSSAGSALDESCGDGRAHCPRGYDFASDRSREQRDFALFVGFGAAGLAALGASALGFTILAAPGTGGGMAFQGKY